MPYSKQQVDSGWEVINSDTGDVKGTHPTEGEADEQLAALYANADPVDEARVEKLGYFIPIQKINAERHEVWGWGAAEEADNADEIMDYQSSKPYWLKWSGDAHKRSGGKSFGNVRSMHQNISTGKLIELRPDDMHKGFYVGVKVVDDNEWKKVEQGVYTGFSVGGSYVKRWSDFQNFGKIRYTANPKELSLVDSPCIKSATFDIVKADGQIVEQEFHPGTGNLINVELDEVPQVQTEDLMTKLQEAYDLLQEVTDDLQKQGGIPSQPEPIADIPLPSQVGPSYETARMPQPNALLEIKPNLEPTQETLAQTTVVSKDLTTAFDSWLPKVGKLIKDTVHEEFAGLQKQALPPAARMIKVEKHKSILVIPRKEN